MMSIKVRNHCVKNAELLHVKFLLDKFNVYSQISSGPNVGPGPGRCGAASKLNGAGRGHLRIGWGGAGWGHSKIERGGAGRGHYELSGAGPYFLSHNMGPNGAPDLAPWFSR